MNPKFLIIMVYQFSGIQTERGTSVETSVFKRFCFVFFIPQNLIKNLKQVLPSLPSPTAAKSSISGEKSSQ